ncbi:excalibur calcium-binding domain-containing protein [Streptomyces sp. NPDC020412]|uniref:excalibur calcium-binding domain-containing protein n=1 Tax=Streptomyces sp. NPDC020412 TaxID=3365073 RepID=UPI0037BC5C42
MKRIWAGGALLMFIGFGCGAVGDSQDDKPPAAAAKPSPAPTVTTTVAPTATATVTATPAPAPTVTVTKNATAAKPPKPAKAPDPAPPADVTEDRDDAGANVYYANCAAARAAGATPVKRGDPGYARHLDRDGDGVGCDRG